MTEDRAAKILSIPPLSKSLPYRFESGCRIDGLTISCCKCGQELSPEDCRGTFDSVNKHTTTLTAFGLCEPCHMITPVVVRFGDDGTFLSRSDGGWIPGRYIEDPPAGFAGLMRRLKVFLSR